MHPHSPAKIHAQGLGATPERAVQLGTADTKTGSAGEYSFSRQLTVEVADAAKRMRVHLSKVHSEPFQYRDPVRHQALAAGFVDGRPGSVENSDLETPKARRDGGGQPRWPSSRDYDISHDPSDARPAPSPVTTAGRRRRDESGSPRRAL